MEKTKALLVAMAIAAVTAIAIAALVRGVDGIVLVVSVVVIALLTPSPLFQVKWRDVLTVIKRSSNGALQQDADSSVAQQDSNGVEP